MYLQPVQSYSDPFELSDPSPTTQPKKCSKLSKTQNTSTQKLTKQFRTTNKLTPIVLCNAMQQFRDCVLRSTLNKNGKYYQQKYSRCNNLSMKTYVTVDSITKIQIIV